MLAAVFTSINDNSETSQLVRSIEDVKQSKAMQWPHIEWVQRICWLV